MKTLAPENIHRSQGVCATEIMVSCWPPTASLQAEWTMKGKWESNEDLEILITLITLLSCNILHILQVKVLLSVECLDPETITRMQLISASFFCGWGSHRHLCSCETRTFIRQYSNSDPPPDSLQHCPLLLCFLLSLSSQSCSLQIFQSAVMLMIQLEAW